MKLEKIEMKAAIIIRENAVVDGKPLPRLWGLTLLERSVYTLQKVGINDFLIVCGSRYDAINGYIENKKLKRDFNLTLFNSIDDIQMNNDHLLVVDSNVIFDENIIKNLIAKANKKSIICVDSSPKYAERDTDLSGNFFNAGIFLCNRGDIHILENIAKNTFISKEVIKNYGMEFYDVNGAFWYRIKTQKDLKIAEDILLNRNSTHIENEGSLINFIRKFPVRFLVKYLAKHAITPNQVSFIAFLSYLTSAFIFSYGVRVYDLVAIIVLLLGLSLDFSDGMLARLKFKTSRYGEWHEHLFDLIGFFSIIIGITIGLYNKSHSILPGIVGMLLISTYSLSSFISKSYREVFKKDINLIDIDPNIKKENMIFRLYNLCEISAKPFLWIVVGALLDLMVICFLIIIINIGIPILIILFLLFKNRARIQ
jgi:phosphatidylglycerophosphate synthase/choline kinase